ncbi:MAG: RNA degradosome polyphosphate kinase [Lachnospiraceae bacterium]|nr:RNA degradosome polyphosphate kinase [Lachnospiraceae bacterium]
MKIGRSQSGKRKKEIDFFNPAYYTNRELSWMLFNERILGEARDKNLPLMERLKFLSITASNLDEFFMVRVASLKDAIHSGSRKPDLAGMIPSEQLKRLTEATHDFVQSQYQTYNRVLLPLMNKNGIHLIKKHKDLTYAQGEYVDRYFQESVYPVLTPMAVDSSRPFPLIRNRSLNLGALIKGEEDGPEFAMVQVPSGLPRVLSIPEEGEEGTTLILLEEVIERNIHKLFLNYKVITSGAFRVMRNADFTVEDDEDTDLLLEIEKQVRKRQWGRAIRLEAREGMDKRLLSLLVKELKTEADDLYFINGPLDLTVLMKIASLPGFDHLRRPPFQPQVPKYMDPEEDIFAQIRDHDILLHHPYETFEPVVSFIQQAASDEQTLAIKQTLYRVSGNSPIIAALAEAAENGKQVTVLVELMARFDERNNILWARRLEQAGCHVIYGLKGLKVHSKITLVVRQEEEGIRRYVHLGTGNYNDSTAKIYTDIGFFTCSDPYGEDATAVFNMLSGYSEPEVWNRLSVAPLWLKDRFLYLIHRETGNAKTGREARIIAKMNSLNDRDIIAALYEASAAGVKVDLIVRGICCLRVGIPGVSENITVRSIVGNYLEHARIFYFYNEGKEELYCGSADWMPRNLERRVEILFPVEKRNLMDDLIHILNVQLNDNEKASILTPEGRYVRVRKSPGEEAMRAQDEFVREAKENARKKEEMLNDRVFTPEKGLV